MFGVFNSSAPVKMVEGEICHLVSKKDKEHSVVCHLKSFQIQLVIPLNNPDFYIDKNNFDWDFCRD